MSKTPDEIVKALKCCGANLPCDYCPYFDECACDCMSSLNNDAAALIDSLQSQLAETKRQLEAAIRMNLLNCKNREPIAGGSPYCPEYYAACDGCESIICAPQDEKGEIK